MRIAYNPKTSAALTAAPSNKDITFDLSGMAIYARGVKFDGKAYNVFKKHASGNTGGYDGLVPVPSYNNNSKNRFLKEDGTWDTTNTLTWKNDVRTTSTIPKDYLSSFTFIGIKNSSAIGSPTTDTFVNLIGWKGYLDNTGPLACELASGLDRISVRFGAYEEWGNWNTLAYLSDINVMVGATASVAGKAGLVPAPGAGKNTSFLRGDGTWAIPLDTKVTSADNHYDPSTNTNYTLDKDASSTTAATWGTTSLVTGVTLSRDSKGHVTGLSIDSIKLPTISNTWRAIQANGTLIAGTGTDTYALNFVQGAGITIKGEAGTSSSANKITITNSGVRSVTINGNHLRVNTNGTNEDLTVPYAVKSGTADKLSTTSKKAWGLTYWTSEGIPTNISGDLTGVGDVVISAGDSDKYIYFSYDGTKKAGASWRTGMVGTGTENANYFVIESGTNNTSATTWNRVLQIGQNNYDATFSGQITATKFIGTLNNTLTFLGGTFTSKSYNNNSAATVNIPTHTSHLINNSGFLTELPDHTHDEYFKFRGWLPSSNANANDYINLGTYLNGTGNGSGNSNFPTTYGYLNTFGNGGSDSYRGWQLYISSGGALQHRAYWGGWTAWRTVLDSVNYTNYINTTNFPGLHKTGTVTSVATGTGLTGGTITTSGTISINSTYLTYISNGNTAYGWGNHASAGYIKSRGYIGKTPVQETSGNLALTGINNITTPSLGFTITTPSGNIQIGPQNTSGCHIYTNRDLFYFNKPIYYWDGSSSHVYISAYNYTSYTPILNSSSTHATKSSVIYAPTTSGNGGDILISDGLGSAPVWTSPGSITVGGASKADKLTVARTIALSGAVTGSASFDGSANITIATSVNHTHSYLVSGSTLSGSSHAEALKTYFTNNKASIPRCSLNTYYSSAMSNGSLYFGYFLSGYDSTPYGGFYVAHYDTPYYVGISYGTFTLHLLAKISDLTWTNITGKPTIPTLYERNIGINDRDWTVYSPYNTNTDRIYAPTSAGTSGQVLVSTGGTPTWLTISTGGGYIGTTAVQAISGNQAITGITGVYTNYSGTSYGLLVNNKNANVLVLSCGGGLYLGYANTSGIYLGNVNSTTTHTYPLKNNIYYLGNSSLYWKEVTANVFRSYGGSSTWAAFYLNSSGNTVFENSSGTFYINSKGLISLKAASNLVVLGSGTAAFYPNTTLTLGTSSLRWNYVYATHLNAEGGSFYTDANGAYWTSDMRLKTNIIKARNLDVADLLVEFDWKESNEHSWGYIAQDLLEVLPEAVSYNSDTDRYAVNYNVAHSAAIASLTARIKELEEKLKKYGLE